MNNLFVKDKFKVRTVTRDGQVLFCARDVAVSLGYQNPSREYNNKCKSLILISYTDLVDLKFIDNNDAQGTVFIKESDVYRLVLKSMLPSADKFQDWIVEEVLPSIRKTGSYSLSQETVKIAPISPIDILPAIERSIEAVKRMFPNLSDNSVQAIGSNLVKLCGYENLIPLPIIKEKRYTVTEMAEFFGVSKQKLGRVISELGLRNSEYSECRLSKSEHSNKQVEQHFYNEQGFNILKGKFNHE